MNNPPPDVFINGGGSHIKIGSVDLPPQKKWGFLMGAEFVPRGGINGGEFVPLRTKLCYVYSRKANLAV